MFTIMQACSQDIVVIENLLTKKIDELATKGIVQWEKEEVQWSVLQKDYKIEDFYIVYKDLQAVGCFSVVDYDPGYWIHDEPHKSLYIHKVMVLDAASGQGASDMILDYFKELGRKNKVKSVKLDVRAHKEKLRAYYERNQFELVEITDLNKGYLTALYEYKLHP